MPKRIFRIDGSVINRQGIGVPDLRIEVWDKDLIFDDLVGTAITDKNGCFQIEFSDKFFRECFLDRHPDLFFKIYRGSQLIKSTEESVLWNVKKREIPVTIEIDVPATDESNEFIVKGDILQADKSPLVDAFVRAFDKDLRSEQLLGEAHTDEEGRYEISYTHAQFRRAEKKSADLIVRVYDPETGSLLLAESELIFNAKPVEVVDLLVTIEISEYERFMAIIEPVRDKVPVAELTADDITFLNHETGIEAHHIELLAIAARLAKQTELPPEFFYGLFRQDQPTTLSDLIDQEEAVLRKALECAIESHVIPRRLRDNLDSYLERLGQLKETDPGIQRKQHKEQLRRLGKIVDLDDAKMEAVVSKAAYPAMVTDKLLSSMVEGGELQDNEAKELGMTVSLYQLCDDNEKLAQAVKKGDFPQLPEGKISRLDDLTAFDKEGWLAILEQAETKPAQGFSREVYAALLAKKIENLYPSKTMLARVT
ncbi:MAG: hypothetical protein KAR13_02830, partial [Desulfobulbaceae bacterium]|nr:hypothetical protein [Desulfobulbaceae bacterium]